MLRNARYYAPQWGQFLTRDPFPGLLSHPATQAPYPYALNNPLRYTDPSGEIPPLLIIAGVGFAAGAVYDAYQQTGGFTTFCNYDFLQTLAWGVGGAAAAASLAVLTVSSVGLVGMGLQGVGLGLSGLGASSSLATQLFMAGTSTAGWSASAAVWLTTSPSIYHQTTYSQSLLPARAGPVANISPSVVIDHTPREIHNRALQLGLEPRGPNPMLGQGAYVDPQTGVQRILIHPNAPPFPHGHVNNAFGQRIDSFGVIVSPDSFDAHLPLRR